MDGTFGFGLADIRFVVQNLPMQIAKRHHVVIDEAKTSHASRGEIEGDGTPEASHTYYQHPRLSQLLLSFLADFGEEGLAVVFMVHML